MSSETSTQPIPIVDIGQLGLGHEPEPTDHEWARVGADIKEAFAEIGFVYITRHGIPEEQIDRIVEAGANFFDLTQEEKDKYPRDSEKQQGYVSPNRERFDPVNYQYELRESYDIKDVDGLFPDASVPDFRPAAIEFLESCKKLSHRILIALALGLGLDRNFFLDGHQELCSMNNASALRLLHYPPVPPDVNDETIRCGAHTDYGTFTLLFQTEMGGLYVRDQTGNWINADPIPGTILVNVGDILQFWASNKLKATEHRVLIPADEARQQKCRRSVVFFVHPDDPVLIKPIDGSTEFEPITAKEHVLKRFSETYF